MINQVTGETQAPCQGQCLQSKRKENRQHRITICRFYWTSGREIPAVELEEIIIIMGHHLLIRLYFENPSAHSFHPPGAFHPKLLNGAEKKSVALLSGVNQP